jgi:hypothetical protein
MLCHEMKNKEVLNSSFKEYPLFIGVLYGDKIECEKFSKRLSCAIKHLPIRVEFNYESNTLEAIKKGIRVDPTFVLDDKILFEGLVQAEEITKKFEDILELLD